MVVQIRRNRSLHRIAENIQCAPFRENAAASRKMEGEGKRVGQNALRMICLWIGRAFVGELLK